MTRRIARTVVAFRDAGVSGWSWLLALAFFCAVFGSGCSRTDGVYLREGIKGDSITLHKDGRFTLRESGQSIAGTYTINGNSVVLTTGSGEERHGEIQGAVLQDPHGNRWIKK